MVCVSMIASFAYTSQPHPLDAKPWLNWVISQGGAGSAPPCQVADVLHIAVQRRLCQLLQPLMLLAAVRWGGHVSQTKRAKQTATVCTGGFWVRVGRAPPSVQWRCNAFRSGTQQERWAGNKFCARKFAKNANLGSSQFFSFPASTSSPGCGPPLGIC